VSVFLGLQHDGLCICIPNIIINTPIVTNRLYLASGISQLLRGISFTVAWFFIRLYWFLARELTWGCLKWY